MGYDLLITARSPKLAEKMFDFLNDNVRDWQAVASSRTEDIEKDFPWFFVEGAQLWTHYGCVSGWERMYVYTLVRWAALQVGKKQRRFANLHENLPGHKLSRAAYNYSYDRQYKIILAVRPHFISLPKHESCVEEIDEDGIPTDQDTLNFASQFEPWNHFEGGGTFCERREAARILGDGPLDQFNEREWSMRTDVLLPLLRREMRELSRRWKEMNGE